MIAIASDHAAFEFKEKIIAHLKSRGFVVKDCGTHDKNLACDYSDFALKACDSVVKNESRLGILICGTGIGMSIAANKVRGIRCAHCSDTFSARMTRLHNDANVLAIGERVLGLGLALDIVDAFVNTAFSNEPRHMNRIKKVMDIENC